MHADLDCVRAVPKTAQMLHTNHVAKKLETPHVVRPAATSFARTPKQSSLSPMFFILLAATTFLSFFSITDVAVLYVADVALLAIALLGFTKASPLAKKIAFFSLMHVCYASLVAHFIHDSEPLTVVKYGGFLFSCASSFLGMLALARRSWVLVLVVYLGLAFSFLMQGLYIGALQYRGEPGWEGGLVTAVMFTTVVIGILLGRLKERVPLWQMIVFCTLFLIDGAVLGVISLAERDRGTAVQLMAQAASFFFVFCGPSRLKARLARSPVSAFFAAVGLAGSLVLLQAYLALTGIIGGDVGEKIRVQWNHPAGYIVAARDESVSAFLVGLKYPLFGIGTSSRDPEAIKELIALDRGYKSREGDVFFERANGYVPLHSTIGGGFARAGIVSLVYWAFILVVLWRGVLASLVAAPWIAGLTTSTAVFAVFGLFFEPYVERFVFGGALAGAVYALDLMKKTRRATSRQQRARLDARLSFADRRFRS